MNALILCVSNTGDSFVFVVVKSIFINNDLLPDISFVSFISLATIWGAVKYILSFATTPTALAADVKLNSDSEPCTDLPVVGLML